MLERRDWKYSLRNLTKFIEECKNNKYRFNLPYVRISSIAEQYYCEAKVHNEYEFGEIATEVKEEGRKIHEELIKMKPIYVENLISSIESKPLCICTFPVYTRVDELVVVGVPDLIVFKDSKPFLLIELKTTSGTISRLWPDEKVQVGAYAYALDYMGFDCSNLKLVIVKVKRGERAISSRILNLIIMSYLGKKSNELRVVEGRLNFFKIHEVAYNKEKIAKELHWAKDYWLKKRDPIPTRKVNKCKVCPYRERCRFSQLYSK